MSNKAFLQSKLKEEDDEKEEKNNIFKILNIFL